MNVPACIPLSLLLLTQIHAQNLNDLPTDLTVPPLEQGAPAAGKRVRQTTAGWEKTEVYHTLYLPTDFREGTKLPVIIEYAGNGGYSNKLGDVSDGTPEGCMLGYGLSGARGFIWACLPFIGPDHKNATRWWGDVEETKRYAMKTVRQICAEWGDSERVILMGFSRGAIACNYIGLHDEDIAQLWCGMLCHSHYEGEFKHPAPDEAAWKQRLLRLGTRPQFISFEGEQPTQKLLQREGFTGDLTFFPLGYPNHSARWVLCDTELRRRARAWLARVSS